MPRCRLPDSALVHEFEYGQLELELARALAPASNYIAYWCYWNR